MVWWKPFAAKDQADRKPKLAITVLGATGDLAKVETFPALLDLFGHGMLEEAAPGVGVWRLAACSLAFLLASLLACLLACVLACMLACWAC